jgi:hypothetical protein
MVPGADQQTVILEKSPKTSMGLIHFGVISILSGSTIAIPGWFDLAICPRWKKRCLVYLFIPSTKQTSRKSMVKAISHIHIERERWLCAAPYFPKHEWSPLFSL